MTRDQADKLSRLHREQVQAAYRRDWDACESALDAFYAYLETLVES